MLLMDGIRAGMGVGTENLKWLYNPQRKLLCIFLSKWFQFQELPDKEYRIEKAKRLKDFIPFWSRPFFLLGIFLPYLIIVSF